MDLFFNCSHEFVRVMIITLIIIVIVIVILLAVVPYIPPPSVRLESFMTYGSFMCSMLNYSNSSSQHLCLTMQ